MFNTRPDGGEPPQPSLLYRGLPAATRMVNTAFDSPCS